MYYYENCCIPTIKPTNIALNGNNLEITLPSEISLLNGKKWYLIICQSLPKGTTIGEVSFVVNGTTINAINGIGNTLRTDALCPRRRYTLTYGWDEPHFMVCGTKESAFIPTTATTTSNYTRAKKGE